jgi:RNA 2',3'-cyclic 3'-phosphodiesterase
VEVDGDRIRRQAVIVRRSLIARLEAVNFALQGLALIETCPKVRTFIAIELDDPLRARVAALAERLKKLAPDARWVRPDRLHLTLAFLGEMADATVPAVAEALGRIASRHSALALQVRGGGVFGALHRPKVLWLPLAGELESLTSLHADLTRELASLGHAPEYETFEPHVTLARSRDSRGDPCLARCADSLHAAELGAFSARALTFFSSRSERDGMNHVALSQHPLL